jgi:hypothetical protein
LCIECDLEILFSVARLSCFLLSTIVVVVVAVGVAVLDALRRIDVDFCGTAFELGRAILLFKVI